MSSTAAPLTVRALPVAQDIVIARASAPGEPGDRVRHGDRDRALPPEERMAEEHPGEGDHFGHPCCQK